MRYLHCLFIMVSLCPAAYHLSAQNLSRFVVGSAGSSTQSEAIRLSFTVGESVAGTLHPAGSYLTQGFQQSPMKEITTGTPLPVSVEKINIYPNPAENLVTVDVRAAKSLEFSLTLYNAVGKELTLPALTGKTSGSIKYQLDLSGLDKGLYYLLIKTKKGSPVKILKLIKL